MSKAFQITFIHNKTTPGGTQEGTEIRTVTTVSDC